MAVKVGMKNDSGDFKSVKVGWSWTCFFFGFGGFGIPWFLRKLPILGACGVIMSLSGLWISKLMLTDLAAYFQYVFRHQGPYVFMIDGYFLLSFFSSIFGGIMANKLTIKNLYKKGYKFTEPNSPEVAAMNGKYHVF